MHPKVEEFLKEEGIRLEKRDDTLLRLGLWEKEYAPDGGDEVQNVTQFPQKDKDGRRWRKKAIEVTEEEWALIQSAAEKKKEGAIRTALKVTGVCCIVMIVLEILSMSISLGNILLWTMGSTFSFGFAQLLEKFS